MNAFDLFSPKAEPLFARPQEIKSSLYELNSRDASIRSSLPSGRNRPKGLPQYSLLMGTAYSLSQGRRIKEILDRIEVYNGLQNASKWSENRQVLANLIQGFFSPFSELSDQRRLRLFDLLSPACMGSIASDVINLGYSTQWKYTFGWPEITGQTSAEIIRPGGSDPIFYFENSFIPVHFVVPGEAWKLAIPVGKFKWHENPHDDVRRPIVFYHYKLSAPFGRRGYGDLPFTWGRFEVSPTNRCFGSCHPVDSPGLFSHAAPALTHVVEQADGGAVRTPHWQFTNRPSITGMSSGHPLVIDAPVISVARYFVGRCEIGENTEVIEDALRFNFCREDGTLIGVAGQRVVTDAVCVDWSVTAAARLISECPNMK